MFSANGNRRKDKTSVVQEENGVITLTDEYENIQKAAIMINQYEIWFHPFVCSTYHRIENRSRNETPSFCVFCTPALDVFCILFSFCFRSLACLVSSYEVL